MLTNKLVWYHDNAQPHMATVTIEIIQNLITIFLDHSWLLICRQWRGEECGAYVALRTTENMLHRWHQEACGLKQQMYDEARELHW